MTCGEKLMQLRKQKGLSQEQVANMLNVSRQAVSRWEMDLTLPDAANLMKLSEVFDVSIDYLLKDDITLKKNYNLHDILSSINISKDRKHIGDILFISSIPLFLFGKYCCFYSYDFFGNLLIIISILSCFYGLYCWCKK